MSHPRLTCLIPTHNRPHFLRRLLHFYKQHPMSCSFFVADSSKQAGAAENVAAVEEASRLLDITYCHFGTDLITKYFQALSRIGTPYVVVCADDDFLLPNAVDTCVEFLELHPEYSLAQGLSANMNCRAAEASVIKVWSGHCIHNESAFARCQQMARYGFSTFYGVYHTNVLRDMFQYCAEHLDAQESYHFPEILLLQLSALKGRIQFFPIMYALREWHGSNLNLVPEAASREKGEELYLRFRDSLVAQIMLTGRSRSQAVRFVDLWYGHMREWGLRQGKRNKWAVRRLWRSIWRIWRQVLNRFSSEDMVPHRALLASDLQGQEAVWQSAVQLMTAYPKGFESSDESWRRAA